MINAAAEPREDCLQSACDFEEFLANRGDALLSLAISLARDSDSGKDLLQEALIRVWPKWQQIDRGKHEAYVRKAIVHQSISLWRNRRWRELPSEFNVAEPSGGEFEQRILDLQVLQKLLFSLPDKQRVALTLRYVHDFPIDEVAALMGTQPGTVKSWCSRGMESLRNSALGSREAPSAENATFGETGEGVV